MGMTVSDPVYSIKRVFNEGDFLEYSIMLVHWFTNALLA